jgi:hypothetical protein
MGFAVLEIFGSIVYYNSYMKNGNDELFYLIWICLIKGFSHFFSSISFSFLRFSKLGFGLDDPLVLKTLDKIGKNNSTEEENKELLMNQDAEEEDVENIEMDGLEDGLIEMNSRESNKTIKQNKIKEVIERDNSDIDLSSFYIKVKKWEKWTDVSVHVFFISIVTLTALVISNEVLEVDLSLIFGNHFAVSDLGGHSVAYGLVFHFVLILLG